MIVSLAAAGGGGTCVCFKHKLKARGDLIAANIIHRQGTSIHLISEKPNFSEGATIIITTLWRAIDIFLISCHLEDSQWTS